MGKLNNDDRFKHVSYHSTDVAKTFARIKKQQAEAAKQTAKVVTPMEQRRKAAGGSK